MSDLNEQELEFLRDFLRVQLDEVISETSRKIIKNILFKLYEAK